MSRVRPGLPRSGHAHPRAETAAPDGLALLTIVVLVFVAAGAYLGWDRPGPGAARRPGPRRHGRRGGRAHPRRALARRPADRASAAGARARLRRVDLRVVAVGARCSPPTATSTPTTCAATAGPTACGPYTLDADTDQLAGVLSALHLTRPIVVGHSLGVAIALSLALRDPATVTGVVAANGDGTPYFGADRSSAPEAGSRALLAAAARARPSSPRSCGTAARSGGSWPPSAGRAAPSTTPRSTAGARPS